ncbi:MAG: CCA tRNA nucleotidyltransferase [archaeon]
MTQKALYKEVIQRITPKKAELAAEKALVEEIRKKVSEIEGKHSHLEWCGSSARGTHLRGDRDLDLFVMFNKELGEKELEEEGLRIGKKIFKGHKWELAYSQHPYIRGVIKGFDVEIVPSYIVASGAEKKSAVDRTPFHNKYLLKHLSENQKSDARMLKQFLKGIDAYGADLKNCALPGYGVELLVHKYKNFDEAIKAISEMKEGNIITFGTDPENAKKLFFNECAPALVIIDPVDDSRNVASALSHEQLARMKKAAQLFIKNPSEKFFFGMKVKLWTKKKVILELAKKEFIAIEADFPKKILPDLVWGQLRRYLKKASNELEENDFCTKKMSLWSDENKVFFMYELDKLHLQKTKKVIGPPAADKENVKRFLEKKRNLVSGPSEENGKIVIVVEREKTSAKAVLEDYIKTCKLDEKEAIKICLRKAKVLTEKNILLHYKGRFAEHITKYLSGKEFFE